MFWFYSKKILLFTFMIFIYKGQKIDYVVSDSCLFHVKEFQNKIAVDTLTAVRKVSKQSRVRMLICVQHVFLMFKHWFCWKYQFNEYTFNSIKIYSFIPVSSCLGIGPRALLYPGAHNTVKMILFETPQSHVYVVTWHCSVL